jgi:hypothetical protein
VNAVQLHALRDQSVTMYEITKDGGTFGPCHAACIYATTDMTRHAIAPQHASARLCCSREWVRTMLCCGVELLRCNIVLRCQIAVRAWGA